MITKPMLASKLKNGDSDLDFEKNQYLATPKIDGIRALKINGNLVSRSFKQIKNTYIRETLERILPDGADGEILCIGEDHFNTGGVMRESGTPEFIFYWFDYVTDSLEKPYIDRIIDLEKFVEDNPSEEIAQCVCVLSPTRIYSLEELKKYENMCLNNGHEGVILRTIDSPYKCGRATPTSQHLIKIKRFSDGEAEIIGFVEKMHNDNPAEKDNFGRTKRSSHKANMRPAGVLGVFKARDLVTGKEFEIGSGYTDALRKEVWDNQEKWLGKIAKYTYFEVGVKDLPRHSVFVGLRDKDDM